MKMKNVAVSREGDTLVVRINLTEPTISSKSGKTLLIATTFGSECVANVEGKPAYLGVNLYVYADREAER